MLAESLVARSVQLRAPMVRSLLGLALGLGIGPACSLYDQDQEPLELATTRTIAATDHQISWVAP